VVICGLLAETSRPEIQPLAQLLRDLKLEDERLTEEHALEAKRVELQRVERLKMAEWERVCWALDGEVLAFMRDLRTDEKASRANIIDGYRSGVAALRITASTASTKSHQTKPSVPANVMKPISVVPAKKEPERVLKHADKKQSVVVAAQTATPVKQFHKRPQPPVSANAVKSPLPTTYAAAAEKALQSPAQQLKQIQQSVPVVSDVQEALSLSVIADQALEVGKQQPSLSVVDRNNDLSISAPISQLAENEPTVSSLASARAGFFSQPAMSSSSAPARRSIINDCILKLPYFIRKRLPESSQGVIDDYFLIYKGMIIKALKIQNQPVSLNDEQCLRDAQRKEIEYFWGFANAFRWGELYSSMERDAAFHANALTYLSEGNAINVDCMLTVFQAALTPKDLMTKIMQLKEPSMPGLVMFPHENSLHKLVFGLLVLICDEMGVGGLVDRQLFIGDYQAYLIAMRECIVSADPTNSAQLLSDIENTAMVCLQRIVKRPALEQKDGLSLNPQVEYTF
jgi:hypothetical protein